MKPGSGNGASSGNDSCGLARKIAAQTVGDRPLAKRFYDAVCVEDLPGGHGLALDGRPVETPLERRLIVPTRALAEAVGDEWERQGSHVRPQTMPLTGLCNVALDRVGADREGIVAEIVGYANSDLLCYRADRPEELVSRQNRLWDPVIEWISGELGANFLVVSGVVHRNQANRTLTSFRRFTDDRSDFAIAGLHNATTLTGSAVLAAAVLRRRLNAEDAWTLAHVDEDWQAERWGRDEEEDARRSRRRDEFLATARFLELAG